MTNNLDEGYEFHIEVQEGVEGTDGEVIIIYNYDGAELTPELLAKTLEELSAQTSLRKNAANQNCIQQKAAQVESANVLNITNISELESGLPSVCNIKGEVTDHSARKDSLVPTEQGIQINAIEPVSDLKVEENADIVRQIVSLEEVKKEKSLQGTNVADSVDKCLADVLSIIATKDHKLASVKEEILTQDTTDEEEEDQEHACDKCSFVSHTQVELQRHKKFDHREEKPFVCRHCAKSFKIELSLEIHKISHSRKGKTPFSKFDPGFIHKVVKHYTCPLCDFQYSKKGQLSNHMKGLHKNKDYICCPQCPYSCLTPEVLDSHVSSPIHEEEKRTLCPLCGTSTKDIKQHLKRTHNDDRPFLCNLCGFKAKTATNLSTHMIIHDPVKRVICTLCQYKCHTKDQLKRHLVKHSSDRNFQCALCNFACKTGMSLKRHMQIHQAPNKYICSVCEFTTHDKMLLRQHKSREHVLKVSHKCPECEIEFERMVELKKHALAVHKSDKINFCSYCDFSGETVTDLRVHMQSHFGKFSFMCSQCGYMCRLKASYRRHMERHDKVKKFACTLCNYSCVEKYDLQKHYTHRHSDEKPLACPYCNYRCKFKPRLNNHIAYVHSDTKPFFCKQCPYTGKSAENLKKHMVNHGVVVKSIQCVLCDYATSERTKLKRHMQVHVKKAIFQ